MKNIFKFICLIAVLAITYSCAYTKESRFRVNLKIEYEYENDPGVSHYVTYEDYYTYNATVTDLKPMYTVDPGYINDLILYNNTKIYTKEHGWHSCGRTNEIVLIKSPDYKLVVTKVIYAYVKIK